MTVNITQYKWAGKLGPFEIKTKCDECDITSSILEDMLEKDFKDKDVIIEIKPWLNNFFYCFIRLAWHAPLILVDGKKFHQFNTKNPIFDRKKLKELVYKKLNIR